MDIVGRHNAVIVDLARGTIDRGLIGFAGAGLGEARVGIGRADHDDAGLVEDGH